MRFVAKIRSAWRSLFRQGDVERDLDDELQCALDELTARYIGRGVPPGAAQQRASLELGRVDRIKEAVRDVSLKGRLDTLISDIVYGWRGLTRTPAFGATVVVILAFGIGAATAIFSVVNALLLEPLPYRDSDRLVFVWQDLTRAGYPRAPLAGPELQDLRDRSTLFSGFGGIWANTTSLTDGTEPEQLRIGLVTPDFFDVLGADALLGRTFKSVDEEQGAPASILLSHSLWKRRYAADPSLVGTRILVSGRPTTVIGVMPEEFRLLLPADSAIPDDQQAWLLLGRGSSRGPRQQQFLRVVGRMNPGVALADAQEEIASIGRQVGREYSEYGPDGATFYGVRLQSDATREVRPALIALFGAVFLLLTIGCVNVAGLLVSRAAARQRETAVRVAIGAGRLRLFRQHLVEGLIFSLAGGAAGLLVARELLSLLIAVRPPSLNRLDVARIDFQVFAFAFAVALAWGVVFSLAPLAQVFRTNASSVLQGLKSGTIVGFGQRLRSGLVVVQVAVSAVLLVTSVLLAKGFYELQKVSAGFDETGVLTFKVSLNGTRHRGVDAAAVFSRQLRERLTAIPGVSAAGAISHLPYDTVPNWGTPYLPEHESDLKLAGVADARAVTPGYFEATGAELIEGRWFTEADSSQAQPVAIVDTLLASRLWPGRSPIGQRVKADPGTTGIPDVTVTVVGVVRHIRHRDVTRDLREQMYFPAQQSFRNPMAYVVRGADGEGTPAAAVVRKIMAEIDPALPIYDVRPLAAYTRDARALRAFTLVLALAFAASAIVLATIGVFGVASHAVAGRQREFGLRFALGAGSGQIAGLVLREAIAIAGWGAALGLFGALLAAPLLRSQLYAVSPLDPRAYALGAALVIVAALTASCIPALRAARTSPLQSLRVD